MTRLLLPLLLFFAGIHALAQPVKNLPTQLTLAATDWCPFSCVPSNSPKQPGIISEYLDQLLQQHNISLNIKFLPWSRALVEANNGSVDGLLTVVPEESNHLLLPKTPTAYYTDCFFVRPNEIWRYGDHRSLDQVNIAYVQDYGYNEPLHSHIRSADNTARVFEVSGADPGRRMVQLVLAGRADAMVEERLVAAWAQKQATKKLGQPHSLKAAGCLNSNPFYLAISPDLPASKELLQLFDRILKQPENLQLLRKITQSYLAD